jgi:Phage integrase family.
MRLKDYDTRDGKRVWLSEREIQQLLANTDTNHTEAQFALRLMARSGLRRQEVTGGDGRHGVRFVDLVDTDDTGAVVRIWNGKGDKYREPPAPQGLLGEADVYRQATRRDPDEELVDADASTLYDWVKRARRRCLADGGDEGWTFVGPHDLRRSWGVRLLEAGVLPSVVMEWGGWNDWDTFRKHYLAEFSPEALRRERGKISWLGGDQATDGADYAAVGSSARQPPR